MGCSAKSRQRKLKPSTTRKKICKPIFRETYPGLIVAHFGVLAPPMKCPPYEKMSDDPASRERENLVGCKRSCDVPFAPALTP